MYHAVMIFDAEQSWYWRAIEAKMKKKNNRFL